jgi:hypothetical protein
MHRREFCKTVGGLLLSVPIVGLFPAASESTVGSYSPLGLIGPSGLCDHWKLGNVRELGSSIRFLCLFADLNLTKPKLSLYAFPRDSVKMEFLFGLQSSDKQASRGHALSWIGSNTLSIMDYHLKIDPRLVSVATIYHRYDRRAEPFLEDLRSRNFEIIYYTGSKKQWNDSRKALL